MEDNLPLLDELRGIAAIRVVVFHMHELTQPDQFRQWISHAYLRSISSSTSRDISSLRPMTTGAALWGSSASCCYERSACIMAIYRTAELGASADGLLSLPEANRRFRAARNSDAESNVLT